MNGQEDVSRYILDSSFMGTYEDDKRGNIGNTSVNNDQEVGNIRRNQRHTPQQTQELGNLVKECTRPNKKRRLPVGRKARVELDSGGETSMMNSNEGSKFLELANVAMNELIMLGEVGNHLFWSKDSSSKRDVLNYEEYRSFFKNGIIKPPGYVLEASRVTSVVPMTSLPLVRTLMDTNTWVNVFAPIVSVASIHKVIPIGSDGPKNGSLQLIQAEFQVISPLVPTRKVKFLRYCNMLRDGLWVIVDVTPPCQKNPNMLSCGASNRLPSGLIIKDMNNGDSKVTWIEQAEYDESHIHQSYKLLIGSGIGLGAKRWLTTLHRHFESLLTLSSINLANVHPGLSKKGATGMVKLAQRMTLNYYSGITGSSARKWERVKVENGGENMSFMIRKNANEPGEHTGIVLSATTSLRFPVNQQTMFDFLTNLSSRNQWDILTFETSIEETMRIPKVKCNGNNVSLLKILRNGTKVLQETWNDASGALVVYAPLGMGTDPIEEEVMRGEDYDSVKLLPSGFSIIPDGTNEKDKTGGGCLLTLGYQILGSSKPTGELNQDYLIAVKKLADNTIGNIKSALRIQT